VKKPENSSFRRMSDSTKTWRRIRGSGHTTAYAYYQPDAGTVSIDANSNIDTSATNAGNGGSVFVESEGTIAAQGAIASRGGTTYGNGGVVDLVSGSAYDIDSNRYHLPTSMVSTRS